ncbi:MAG: hypothetical protein IJN81_12050 [Clostridia bacterium]|nr:hypothetical protein [Clostridia bacterium]
MDLLTKPKIKQELQKLNIPYSTIDIIQNKDGVIVARVRSNEKSYIVKYFQNEEYKREINNYKLLNSLNIPTVSVIGFTDSAIFMEDISQSDTLRLGTKDDLNDVVIARRIAEWYKLLHTNSKDFTEKHISNIYDETDFITRNNIEIIKEKTGTQSLPVWKLVEDNFDFIVSKIKSLPRVLTYNDFYYTNLIVAKDKSSAFMFDYNLLGKGYVYSDIRNVCSSLSKKAQKAFVESYGEFDNNEKIVDDVASVLITLYYACQRTAFPSWAEYAVGELKTDYENKVLMLIKE